MPIPTLLAAIFASGLALAQEPPAGEEAAPAPAPAPVTYKLGAGSLIAVVRKDETTLAAGLSHNHAIKATGWSGSFTWDAANGTCAVDATVPVSGLRPDEPATRKAGGLAPDELDAVSEGQREDIKKNMLAKDQLDVAGFPNITFKATSCALSGDTLTLDGQISIRGKSKAVKVPLKGFSAGDTLTGSGSFTATHQDFGFEPFSAMFGQLRNDPTIKFIVSLNGKK